MIIVALVVASLMSGAAVPAGAARKASGDGEVRYTQTTSTHVQHEQLAWASNGDLSFEVSDGDLFLVSGKTAYECGPTVRSIASTTGLPTYAPPAKAKYCLRIPHISRKERSALIQLFVGSFQHPLKKGSAYRQVVKHLTPAGHRRISGISSACVSGHNVLVPTTTLTVCTALHSGLLTYAAPTKPTQPTFTVSSLKRPSPAVFRLPHGITVLSKKQLDARAKSDSATASTGVGQGGSRTGPPCTPTALEAAARVSGSAPGSVVGVNGYQCTGGFAYANVTVRTTVPGTPTATPTATPTGTVSLVTVFFVANGSTWSAANGSTYCADGQIPMALATPVCATG